MRLLGVGEKGSDFGNIFKVVAMGFAECFNIGCKRKKRQEYSNVFGLSNAMNGVHNYQEVMTAEEWVCGKFRSLVLTF